MRHRRKGKIFGRERNQRIALMRALATALLTHGKIKTTEVKAKALRSYVEPLISLGRANTLANRRRAGRTLDTETVSKLFADIGPRFRSRPGGYTRIIKAGTRAGDAARLAYIELVA
jgi:large subunit ribosomal protein L17